VENIVIINEAIIKYDANKMNTILAKYGGDMINALEKEYNISGKHYTARSNSELNLTRDSMKAKNTKINRFLRDVDAKFVGDTGTKHLVPDSDGFTYTPTIIDKDGNVISAGGVTTSAPVKAEIAPEVKAEKKVVTAKAKPAEKSPKPSVSAKSVSPKKEEPATKVEPEPSGKALGKVSDGKLKIIKKSNSAPQIKLYNNIGEFLIDQYFYAGLRPLTRKDLSMDVSIVVTPKNEIIKVTGVITYIGEYDKVDKNSVMGMLKDAGDGLENIKTGKVVIDEMDRPCVEVVISDEFMVSSIIRKFKLDEAFGFVLNTAIFEGNDAGEEDSVDVYTGALKKYFPVVADMVDSFDLDFVEKTGGYDCFFIFNEGTKTADVTDKRIFVAEDGKELIGYCYLGDKKTVEEIKALSL
jgi:hypothetical protein